MNRLLQERQAMKNDSPETDPLVAAADARRELGGISAVTEWRWREAGILPRPHRVRNRNYYRRSELEAVKAAAAEPGGVAA
jgi:hypothetical protein